MKRRTLKKNLNYLTQELMTECLWIMHCQKSANIQDVENIIDNIILTQDEMLSRISHADKKKAKLHFKKMRAEFLSRVDDIVEQIKNLA